MAKKGQIFQLDKAELLGPREDTALLMFHSIAPNYLFVDDLNQLYDLRLHRVEDMALAGEAAPWPLFAYHDKEHRLQYYLAERHGASNGMAPYWAEGYKVLTVLGGRAEETVEAIHEEFTLSTGPDDPLDINQVEHHNRLDAMRADFTITTRLDPDRLPPESSNRKERQRFLELTDLLNLMLDQIDLKYGLEQ